MSNAFHETAKALGADPALANQVMAAGTPAERATILATAGVSVPTHADVSAAHALLNDVAGAGAGTAALTAGVAECAMAPAAASANAGS